MTCRRHNQHSPILPIGWDHWTFWQYTDGYYFPGCSCVADGDWFNGTLTQMRQWFGNYRQVDPAPSSPYQVRSLFDRLHIRQQPDISSKELGHLAKGEVVDVKRWAVRNLGRHARGGPLLRSGIPNGGSEVSLTTVLLPLINRSLLNPGKAYRTTLERGLEVAFVYKSSGVIMQLSRLKPSKPSKQELSVCLDHIFINNPIPLTQVIADLKELEDDDRNIFAFLPPGGHCESTQLVKPFVLEKDR
jgi:hypothetical protein